ncbi:collagen alpha-1(I) chain-like [Dasypus novemcinctus]|uniref:collagen alpha-1(I) chain-like n=1 Tax=Dasypus novemcinctus TaxID=9361 RepID=UPI0039C9DE94
MSAPPRTLEVVLCKPLILQTPSAGRLPEKHQTPAPRRQGEEGRPGERARGVELGALHPQQQGLREGTCGAQTQRIRCRVPCSWKKELGADCKDKLESWGACDGGAGTLKKASYNAQCQETIRVTKPRPKLKKGRERTRGQAWCQARPSPSFPQARDIAHQWRTPRTAPGRAGGPRPLLSTRLAEAAAAQRPPPPAALRALLAPGARRRPPAAPGASRQPGSRSRRQTVGGRAPHVTPRGAHPPEPSSAAARRRLAPPSGRQEDHLPRPRPSQRGRAGAGAAGLREPEAAPPGGAEAPPRHVPRGPAREALAGSGGGCWAVEKHLVLILVNFSPNSPSPNSSSLTAEVAGPCPQPVTPPQPGFQNPAPGRPPDPSPGRFPGRLSRSALLPPHRLLSRPQSAAAAPFPRLWPKPSQCASTPLFSSHPRPTGQQVRSAPLSKHIQSAGTRPTPRAPPSAAQGLGSPSRALAVSPSRVPAAALAQPGASERPGKALPERACSARGPAAGDPGTAREAPGALLAPPPAPLPARSAPPRPPLPRAPWDPPHAPSPPGPPRLPSRGLALRAPRGPLPQAGSAPRASRSAHAPGAPPASERRKSAQGQGRARGCVGKEASAGKRGRVADRRLFAVRVCRRGCLLEKREERNVGKCASLAFGAFPPPPGARRPKDLSLGLCPRLGPRPAGGAPAPAPRAGSDARAGGTCKSQTAASPKELWESINKRRGCQQISNRAENYASHAPWARLPSVICMSHPRARHFLLAAPAPARHPPASDRGGGTGPERGLSASSLREEEGKPQTRETHTCQHFFPHVFQANSHVDRRARRTAVYRPPDLVFLRSLPYPRTPEPSPDPGRSSFAHSPAERPGRARSERLAERTRPGEEGPSGLGAPGPGRGGEAAPEGRGREVPAARDGEEPPRLRVERPRAPAGLRPLRPRGHAGSAGAGAGGPPVGLRAGQAAPRGRGGRLGRVGAAGRHVGGSASDRLASGARARLPGGAGGCGRAATRTRSEERPERGRRGRALSRGGLGEACEGAGEDLLPFPGRCEAFSTFSWVF